MENNQLYMLSPSPQFSCPGGTIYVIKPGDSYYSLARRFNITIQAMIDANPGVIPTNLQLGQQICIPVPPSPGTCPGGFIYIVQSGDTFFSIARRRGIAISTLIAANPQITDITNLKVGDPICIPA